MSSKEWFSKRKKKLDGVKHKCQLCNSAEKLQVHHKTYERIYNELQSDLIVLCEKCHQRFHNIVPKEKVE